ncbi:MAG: hypothetical protein PHO64_12710 [Thiomonas sp.]|nr:hypothetical protein [Thiomonas sp.]MDE1978378.1 hypothetical protein [Betaproteobacteria bacterium]MDE2175676.1 hypothetical protein [Betaproteobacteria bacterium]MDE2270094.1 hypothetical protein [Betaproteobacteria bacterium]
MSIISNLLATLLGLWMSYAAVLDLSRLRDGAWDVYAAAAIAIVLGLLSRQRDFARWPGTTEIVAALVAIATLALFHTGVLNGLVAFWLVFFAGNVISVLAFWAALYRPKLT